MSLSHDSDRPDRLPDASRASEPQVAPIWLALPIAARRLRMSGPQVINLIRQGKLIGRLIGGARWFVRFDSLRRYLQRERAA